MNVIVVLTIIFWYFCSHHCFNSHWNLYRKAEESELNFNQTFFPTLKNYHVNAIIVTESEYPWIARVIHSQKNYVPLICTAICIEENIFITAARCVAMLKLIYTSLIYQKQRLTAKAFVMPSKESKQLYDDIGFIVVNNEFSGKWEKVETFNTKRTDNIFKWFENIIFDEYEHKVIGYAMKKGSEVGSIWEKDHQLTELEVVVNINLCQEILAYNKLIVGFNVPCYHSCSSKAHENDDTRCDNYHGVLGGALINNKSKKLFGVATWGAYSREFELPVGFAVPNSESYFEDLACALKISDNQNTNVNEGYYQELCDAKRKYVASYERNYKDHYNTGNNWQHFLY